MSLTMEYEALATGDATMHLKCNSCNNPLSFFPIYLSSDGTNLCGRCYDPASEKKHTHNVAYETVAQSVRFPCRYTKQGCDTRLQPLDMAQHEEKCVYRLVTCPTLKSTQCIWEGALSAVIYHCYEQHRDMVLNNGEFDVNLAESHDSIDLLEFDSTFFIVTRKFYAINKLLELHVHNVDYGEVSSETRTCELQFQGNGRCLTVQCETSPPTEKKVTEIFLDSLKNHALDAPLVHCTISLQKPKEKDEKTVDRELLSLLKCSYCNHYALPPIYKVPANNLFEGEMKIKCGDCPRTVVNVYNGIKQVNLTREHGLEQLARKLNYPCKFEKNGCTLVGHMELMSVHKDFCGYGQYPCPVAEYTMCKWFGSGRNIESHVHLAHKDIFKEVSSEISESFSVFKTLKFYLIQAHHRLFQVCFLQKNNSFCWSVHVMGEAEMYAYELEIISQTRDKKLVVRGTCSRWQKKEQLFTFITSKQSFLINQLDQFINSGFITLKVNILT